MRIRRFTPMAERILNLIPSDVGRPIDQINPNIVCPDLTGLIRGAIDRVTPMERQVSDRTGRWYSLRIRPYKSIDNRIDGAVLALFDASDRQDDRARGQQDLEEQPGASPRPPG
jgi:two-component system CheB/CheR fusion protein